MSLPKVVLAAAISCAAVGAALLIEGKVGFSFWDEGFLWYGAKRVLAGEVPIRDFMAYDPARYYWSGAVMAIRGDDGILSLRLGTALFQLIGVFLGLYAILRWSRTTPVALLLLAAVTLTLWMIPRHKVFDSTIAIALIVTTGCLTEHPSRRRFFAAGTCVGLIALFGRNHGLYGAIGSALVLAWIGMQQGLRWTGRAAVSWVAGAFIGYLPMLAIVVFVPGFASAFWDSVRFYVELGATNIALPVPWPWRASMSASSWQSSTREVLIGLLFIAVALYGVIGTALLFKTRRNGVAISPLVAGSIFMGVPYAHFAFSRADLSHLAQSIFPLLLGTIAWIAMTQRRNALVAGALVCAATLIVTVPARPAWVEFRDGGWIEAQVARDRLFVDQATAADLALLTGLVNDLAANGRSFVVTPFWPGAYAVFDRKSPMWEIYALVPRNRQFEEMEIDRIKRADPAFVLVLNFPLDGREDLRYRSTHPLLHQYFRENLDPMASAGPNGAYEIYRQRLLDR